MNLRVALLAGVLLVAGCGRFGEAERCFAEGRYEESLAKFRALEESEGLRADPAVSWGRASAALRMGRILEAEEAADRAADADPETYGARRDFLSAACAWARALVSEAESQRAGADPTSLARAIVDADFARRRWQSAAASEEDWPEARRNAQRAAIKVADLLDRKSATERRKSGGKRPNGDRGPQPEPPKDPARDRPPGEDARITAEMRMLSPADLAKLLDRLGEKEQEKLALRRASRAARPVAGEKDW